MTGYRDEDFTYRSYDLETIQAELTWRVRVYKEGKLCYLAENKRKKEACKQAKQFIDRQTKKDEHETESFWRGR